MKPALLLCLLALAGCGGGGSPAVSYAPAPPDAPPAPPFSLKLLDGKTMQARSLWRSRPAVLFFFSSWCSECATEQKELGRLAERYGDDVAFLGIAGSDKPAPLKSFVGDHEVGYPVGIDPDLAIWKRYAIRTPPAVVLVSRGGRLLRGWPRPVGGALERELSQVVRER
jgi:peroxiredoxin